jgi:hypothetical protein
VKQPNHFFARLKQTLRFGENIFQQHAVIEPTPQEDEDKRRNVREDESLHELEI